MLGEGIKFNPLVSNVFLMFGKLVIAQIAYWEFGLFVPLIHVFFWPIWLGCCLLVIPVVLVSSSLVLVGFPWLFVVKCLQLCSSGLGWLGIQGWLRLGNILFLIFLLFLSNRLSNFQSESVQLSVVNPPIQS